jgi:hypothetical protein
MATDQLQESRPDGRLFSFHVEKKEPRDAGF